MNFTFYAYFFRAKEIGERMRQGARSPHDLTLEIRPRRISGTFQVDDTIKYGDWKCAIAPLEPLFHHRFKDDGGDVAILTETPEHP